MEGLKDIKGIVEVQDYSLWILLSLIVGALLVLFLAIYFFKNRRRKRVKLSLKQKALLDLKSIDFKDTKNTVYIFSQNFQYFLNETNEEEFKKLQDELLEFKYKKEVAVLSSDLENRIKKMIKEIK